MNPPGAIEQHRAVEAFGRRHRTGLVALLFTDIVGSTLLKQTCGDREAVSLIEQHHKQVRSLLSTFQEAEEIGTAGDSFLLVFAKPSEAVRFALQLQSSLEQLAVDPVRAVRDRIGIHVGEVVIAEQSTTGRPKELFGIQVDTCARVMSLAGAAQILMTRFAFDSARQVLKGVELGNGGELKWLNHGPYLLKGLDEPLEICEARLGSGGDLVTPPPSTEKARRYAAPGEEPILGWRPAVGQILPGTQWMLESKLGEGGFGEVWLALHGWLKEHRVFKFCFRADRVRALKREMTLFRVLKERVGEHPNLIRLLDVNLERPPFYLEEEYVIGRDLRTWCSAQGGVQKVPVQTRLELVAQAAEGLAAAHECGVVHRDIKPGNILIAESSPGSGSALRMSEPRTGSQVPHHSSFSAKLTDFGIGQVLSAEYLAGLTVTGMTQTIVRSTSSSLTGTHLYMAPELLAGRPATARSDIYALGVVLYQLLVGDFTCPVTLEWADHVSEPLLREDLKRCFAGDPNNRFVSARELASQIRLLDQRREQRASAAKEVLERGEGRIASLAVMPFANLSAEPESDFLSDGLAEDLITALSQVPGLRVPGRTSCFVFKNKAQDLRTIGQTLNVQSILEGSLRKAGNRLRVTVQLINAADGFHLWSERYDRTMADVFAIQDDISQSIVKALMPKLASKPPALKVQAYGGNVEAYELCLRGRFQQQKWTPEGFALAIQFFQQALQRDPGYPLAYVGLSLVFSLISYFGGLRPDDGMVKGIASAKRAIELDETLSDAHIRLADGLYFYERDWAGAEREFLRALELNPKNAEAHYRYGFFLWAHGRYEPAVTNIKVALELDPFCLDANWWLTFALISLKRFDEAIERGRKMVANDPSYWGGHSVQPMVDSAQGKWADAAEGYCKVTSMMPSPVNIGILCFFYGRAEKKNEAQQLLQQMEQTSRQQYVPQVWLALAYEGLRAYSQAQACLEQAIQDHDSAVVHVRGLGSWWPELFPHSQARLTSLGLW